ncbi:hypothetical protein VCHA53O466_40178 [Vibrio chagasii]|nr:hypothetical protein VCHA53O466_40178 [Vibrio chagasii]
MTHSPMYFKVGYLDNNGVVESVRYMGQSKPIVVSNDGEVTFAGQLQQSWKGSNPDVMLEAMFSGQKMTLIQKSDDEPNVYELHYLGFVCFDIDGIEHAKNAAPYFAERVLLKMANLINVPREV